MGKGPLILDSRKRINLFCKRQLILHFWGGRLPRFPNYFQFFQYVIFSQKSPLLSVFIRFIAELHFLRTDFIDSGGVKNTNTEKHAFLRSDFCCPQKLISWVYENHVGLKTQTNKHETKQKSYFESRDRKFGPLVRLIWYWIALNLGVWNSDPCFKWMGICKKLSYDLQVQGSEFRTLAL